MGRVIVYRRRKLAVERRPEGDEYSFGVVRFCMLLYGKVHRFQKTAIRSRVPQLIS